MTGWVWARCALVRRGDRSDATRRTVIVAGAANLVVGLTKLVAGVLSGSSAMLAEAAHSVADTLDQAFLLMSLRRARRPASHEHPFGHGQERYFWALLAAFGIFIAGAGFSVFEGVLAITRPHAESPLAAYVALAVAFVAEGTSLARAFWQVRREARHREAQVPPSAGEATPRPPRGVPGIVPSRGTPPDPRANLSDMLRHVESSPDITVKVALFEDSAAVIGLVFAALGVGLRQLTGSAAWDGGASIAIGALLVVVAVKLGMDSKELLIGRAADPEVERLIRAEIEGRPGVDSLLELQTMHMGPDALIVAARVALSDGINADQAEDLADEIDRRLSDSLPLQPYVFIDPTQDSHPPSPAHLGSRRLAKVFRPR